MTAFSANLNKIALLRNTRDNGLPDVARCGQLCLDAGADGLTVHPRPDQRHTRPADVQTLRALTSACGREFNVEGYPSEDFIALVIATKPEQCTLVPDWPGQRTSDHGWDVAPHRELLTRVVARLRAAHIYTEPYARAFGSANQAAMLARYAATARAASDAGLGVNAGHDLSLLNLAAFLNAVPNVLEVSIGHAVIAEALEMGLAEATRRYVGICRTGPGAR